MRVIVQQGEINSAEVQQCQKRRENFKINHTHCLKSGKLLSLNNKENHSNFGAKCLQLLMGGRGEGLGSLG